MAITRETSTPSLTSYVTTLRSEQLYVADDVSAQNGTSYDSGNTNTKSIQMVIKEARGYCDPITPVDGDHANGTLYLQESSDNTN